MSAYNVDIVYPGGSAVPLNGTVRNIEEANNLVRKLRFRLTGKTEIDEGPSPNVIRVFVRG